jgi:hypothetical protein
MSSVRRQVIAERPSSSYLSQYSKSSPIAGRCTTPPRFASDRDLACPQTWQNVLVDGCRQEPAKSSVPRPRTLAAMEVSRSGRSRAGRQLQAGRGRGWPFARPIWAPRQRREIHPRPTFRDAQERDYAAAPIGGMSPICSVSLM